MCDRKIGPYDCCSVVCCDCLEAMKALPDGCVDAVITSPPYDAARIYAGNWKLDIPGTFCEIARILSITGSVLFNIASTYEEDGGESLTPYMSVLEAESAGLRLKQHHVYFRHGAPGPRWSNMRKNRVDHEHLFHFCKSPRQIKFNLANVLVKSRWGGSLTFGVTTERQADGTLRPSRQFQMADMKDPGTVWDVGDMTGCFSDELKRQHPATFGDALPVRGIKQWTDEGDTILEPFSGSGTTLVAAKKLGRHYLGFEISQTYVDIARKRLDAIDAQPSLFAPKPEQLTLGGE
jgi:DNA modification methylase